MSYKLVVASVAQHEIAKALAYYSEINASVAERFLTALDIAYDKLEVTPQRYSYFENSKLLRSLALINFPYWLIFSIKNDEVIVIGCIIRIKIRIAF